VRIGLVANLLLCLLGSNLYALAQATSPGVVPSVDEGKERASSSEVQMHPKTERSASDAKESGTAAGKEIEIGKMFEAEDRLDDAEKAYSKALEKATGPEREEAKKCLEAVLKKKQSFWVKYCDPWIEKFQTSLTDILFGVVGALLTLLLFWFLKWLVGYLGRSWGKNRLRIGEFTDATSARTGLALAEILKDVVEEVQEYYRPRDRFRFGAFSSLILVDSPGSSELMELVAEVIPGESNKILDFVSKGYRKPHYLITGMVQEAGLQYRLLVKLLRKDATIQVWDVTVPSTNLHQTQGDLALDVVLYLKGVVEANAE
jgi:hypothetical protein